MVTNFQKLRWLGFGSAPFLWVVFVLDYTDRSYLFTPRNLSVVLFWPVVVNLLIWSNNILSTLGVGYSTDIWVNLRGESGWLYFGHIGISFLLIGLGTGIILFKTYRESKVFRYQGIAIIAGVVFLWTGTLVSILELYGHIHALPLGFVLAGTTFLVAIRTTKLTNVAPIARTKIIETIPAGVVVLDTDDRVVEINSSARELFGLSDRNNVLTSHVEEVFSGRPKLYEEIKDFEEGSVEVEMESEYDTSETDIGTQVPHTVSRTIEVEVSPLYDSASRYLGRALLFYDVTDQKLRQKNLEEQNQKLDEFASVVSHDLRNPLSIASSYVELAQQTDDDEYFEKTKDAHKRMERIIDDVLTMARSNEEKEGVDEIDIGTVARSSWQNVNTEDLEVVIEEDISSVEAERGRVTRIFENLFRNSAEHAEPDSTHRNPEENKEIVVRVGELDGNEGFYVEDNGQGIPEENVEEILETGYTTSDEGTGYGLGIVQEICDSYGWDIEVTESEVGGARFEIHTGS